MVYSLLGNLKKLNVVKNEEAPSKYLNIKELGRLTYTNYFK
jgi:hypothetical protein